MPDVIIGTSPTTGEVLVKDTDTGNMSWQPGTAAQIASATAGITAEEYGGPAYIPPTYEAPPPVPVPTPVPVPPGPVIIAKVPGVTPTAPPPVGYAPVPVVLPFMSQIVELLNGIGGWFYELYLDTYAYITPFNVIGSWFYQLSATFYSLAWSFSDFASWANEVATQLSGVLSWGTIWGWLLAYVPNLEDIRDWFYNWYTNVAGVVGGWWSSAQFTVLAWVQDARSYALTLTQALSQALTTLRLEWDNFRTRVPTIEGVLSWWGNWAGHVLTTVNSWWSGRLTEVQQLLDSAFLARDSLWAGWQDLRDQVAEFFADPEQWVYNRLDTFFERFW